jgi:hypothetical protein
MFFTGNLMLDLFLSNSMPVCYRKFSDISKNNNKSIDLIDETYFSQINAHEKQDKRQEITTHI